MMTSESEALNKRGNEAYLSGDLPLAAQTYREASDLVNHTVAKYQGNLSQVLLAQDDNQGAAAAARKALDIDRLAGNPPNPKFVFRFASAELRLQRVDSALEALTEPGNYAAMLSADESLRAPYMELRMTCERESIPEPPGVLPTYVMTPNTAASHPLFSKSQWYESVPRDKVYDWFVDCVALSVEDAYVMRGDIIGAYADGANGTRTEAMRNFRSFMRKAQNRNVLPPWWDDSKALAAATKTIHFALEKSDIVQKYDGFTPMAMRMVAERVLSCDEEEEEGEGYSDDEEGDADESSWEDLEEEAGEGQYHPPHHQKPAEAIAWDELEATAPQSLSLADHYYRYCHLVKETKRAFLHLPQLFTDTRLLPLTLALSVEILLVHIYDLIRRGVVTVELRVATARYVISDVLMTQIQGLGNYQALASRRFAEFHIFSQLPSFQPSADPRVSWASASLPSVGAIIYRIFMGSDCFAAERPGSFARIASHSKDKEFALNFAGSQVFKLLPTVPNTPYYHYKVKINNERDEVALELLCLDIIEAYLGDMAAFLPGMSQDGHVPTVTQDQLALMRLIIPDEVKPQMSLAWMKTMASVMGLDEREAAAALRGEQPRRKEKSKRKGGR